MKKSILYLFTRTPLHVGSGESVGAIDQPVQRERHTGFPVIPGSSIKGSFADQWPVKLKDKDNNQVRLTTKKIKDSHVIENIDNSGAAWLFGSDNAHAAFAGSLQFSEARIIAFPIRSARGLYAWITCPLMLQRAKRDGAISSEIPPEPKDEQAIFSASGPLVLENEIVLEEYCFQKDTENNYPQDLAEEIADLVSDDLFASITTRLVILSNGMMSHFASTTCEVAQHVRISDETGTAEGSALFNQENVPSDTLFYSTLNSLDSRCPHSDYRDKVASDSATAFTKKIKDLKVFQFGGNASTGQGFCTVTTDQ